MTELPRLHAVTDDRVLARESWPTSAAAVAEACGPRVAVHVRGPRTSGAMLFRRTSALVAATRHTGTPVLVNDRVDVAMAAGADGAHLGRRSLGVPHARALLGRESWIGCSCHQPAEVESAGREGADYAFVGTIFPTPSHPGRPGMGVAGFREARRGAGAVAVPLIGIGGIEIGSVAALIGAGAYGVAVVRGVWERPDPARAASEYLEEIERTIDG